MHNIDYKLYCTLRIGLRKDVVEINSQPVYVMKL